MKQYTQKVEHCTQCPNVCADINVTRWQCGLKNRKFICWMDEGEDTEPIPDWCELDDV